MRRQRRSVQLFCLLFSFVLMAAACSSDDKKPSGAGASSSIAPEPDEPTPIFDAGSTTGYDQVSKLECSPDGKTITLTFDKPFADYQGMFQGAQSILPAHVLEAKTGIADITKLGIGAGASSSDAAPGGSEGKTLTRAAGNPGGKLTFGQEQEYTSYNQTTSTNTLLANTFILNLTLPQVFITDGDLNLVLNTELMKSVTVKSKDPQVVEYVVQPDAIWQDGNPIDCDDFYLNWLAQSGKAESSPASQQAELKKAGDFWNTGWDGFDPTTAISGAWYKITSFNKGQDLTLELNEKYYGPRGKLDTIVFKQVPDATQEPTALANNDVQVIYPQVNPDILANLNNIADATTSVNFGPNWEHLDFNHKHPILKDKVVRQAFALGVDVQEIVNKELGPVTDKGSPLGNRLLLSNQAGYKDNRKTADLDFTTPDTDKAMSLLEAAGWKAGPDGVRVKDGQRLSIKIGRRDPNPRRQSIIETVASQLKPVGFEIIEAADPTFNAELLPAGNFDIAIFGFTGTPFLTGNEGIYAAAPGEGQNFNNVDIPAVVPLFKQLGTEFESDKQKDIANQIDVLLWDDMASLPLFQAPDILSFRNNVKNVVYNGAQGPTWNAFDWSLS